MSSNLLFHIWRNLPVGRETLLQSIAFAQRLGDMSLAIYRPAHREALMYFTASVVTLDLDSSYLAFPDTSLEHLHELFAGTHVTWKEVHPTGFTASTLPNLPTDFSVMTCPRVMSDDTRRIGLGHIGTKVRTLVKNADCPVLIPCLCNRPWNRVAAFFGGSDLGLRAVDTALKVSSRAQVPLTVYTQLDDMNRDRCATRLRPLGIDTESPDTDRGWVTFTSGAFEQNLYDIPSDALVVVGAAGENVMRELVFGSKLEAIQSTLPNPLLVIGPNCQPTL